MKVENKHEIISDYKKNIKSVQKILEDYNITNYILYRLLDEEGITTRKESPGKKVDLIPKDIKKEVADWYQEGITVSQILESFDELDNLYDLYSILDQEGVERRRKGGKETEEKEAIEEEVLEENLKEVKSEAQLPIELPKQGLDKIEVKDGKMTLELGNGNLEIEGQFTIKF